MSLHAITCGHCGSADIEERQLFASGTPAVKVNICISCGRNVQGKKSKA